MCNDDSNMPRPRRRYPTSIRESHCARTGSGGGALEGWDPSDEQIAELEAVMIGMLSRREYFEQELARASASRLRFPRGSAGDDQRRTSIAVHRFSRTISTYEIPPHCNHSSSRRPRFAWVRRISAATSYRTRETQPNFSYFTSTFSKICTSGPDTSEPSTSGKVRQHLLRSRRFGTTCPRWKRSSPPSIG